ncbi:allantoate amidohydrolase [Georgenia sp. AZ-5]|uniref:allantoate amidohydrolase n=1 Tax=Georgenia sp. AZ-5 TaxID=3367526 RepID=UPI003754825B
MSSAGTLAEALEVLARCDELARCSARPDAVERVHLSPEHAAANRVVAGWMREAGLRAWQDAAGNVCGRLEGAEPGLPAVVLGSHLDTVPDAGRYDGVLGVLLAVAVAARVRTAGRALPFALEVVGFSEEEGTRFGTALLGSRAFAGSWRQEWWDLADPEGTTLGEAFAAFGLDPARVGEAARRPEDLVGYLEAHIEQGPSLEDAGRPLGVVSSIAGARRWHLTVTGRAGHAGAAPYERRRDALVGAAELVVEVERLGRATGCVATVGRLQAYPGGVNVIPGRVELSLDLRAERDADRDRLWEEISAAAVAITSRRGLTLTAGEIHRADATECAPPLREAVAAGIRATGDAVPLTLWSRAGHDGMAVADVTGVAMLFVRCAGGVSHHPDESVTADDVAAALDAYEAAVLALAARERPRPPGPTRGAVRRASPARLRAELAACLNVPRWVDEVAAGAPYGSREDLLAAARTAADPLTPAEVERALADHPRIGERPSGDGTAQRFSRREQAAADAEDPVLAMAIAAGNREYEERFGRIFLIRAAGRSRAEILHELNRRLMLGDAEDLAVVGEQLREIALLRIAALWEQEEER